MIDDDIIRRAHAEIGRLNRELAAIHEDEERCKLRRSRIETQKAQVQLLIDQHNLARRLAAQEDDPTRPIVRIEKDASGVNFVRIEKPKQPAQQAAAVPSAPPSSPRRLKPAGLPSIPVMILEALSDGKPARPVEIAEYVRRKYWPDLDSKTIGISVWQMAKVGRLAYHDGQYSLPMASVEAPLVSQNGIGVPEAAE